MTEAGKVSDWGVCWRVPQVYRTRCECWASHIHIHIHIGIPVPMRYGPYNGFRRTYQAVPLEATLSGFRKSLVVVVGVEFPGALGSKEPLYDFLIRFQQIHPDQPVDHVGKGLVPVESQELAVEFEIVFDERRVRI